MLPFIAKIGWWRWATGAVHFHAQTTQKRVRFFRWGKKKIKKSYHLEFPAQNHIVKLLATLTVHLLLKTASVASSIWKRVKKNAMGIAVASRWCILDFPLESVFFFFARFTEIFQFNTHFNILLPFPADAAGANVCGVVCTFGSEVKHGFEQGKNVAIFFSTKHQTFPFYCEGSSLAR